MCGRRKGKRRVKVLFLSFFMLIALALSLFFLQPLNVISIKAEYEGAHLHFIEASPHICLIFKVQNPRGYGVRATIEIELSDQGVPVWRILTVIDDSGNKFSFNVKGNYAISLEVSLSPNEIKRFHVVLKRS